MVDNKIYYLIQKDDFLYINAYFYRMKIENRFIEKLADFSYICYCDRMVTCQATHAVFLPGSLNDKVVTGFAHSVIE